MAEPLNPPEAILATLAQAVRDARSEAQRLRDSLTQAERTLRAWEQARDFTERNWPAHLLATLTEHRALLATPATEDRLAALTELEHIARAAASKARPLFPGAFEEVCKRLDIPLDRESRHPRYSVKSGFIWVQLDDSRNRAKLYDVESQLAELPADPEAIGEVLQRELRRIFERPFSSEAFFRLLRREYDAITKSQKLAEGEAIGIRQITRRLGKNKKGFRTDEFVADLSRLIEAGATQQGGFRLDLQQTKDTSQGMLLHGIAGRGYVGYLAFKRVAT